MPNHPDRSTLSKISTHSKVQTVDDERAIGNGIIITLKKGWSWDPLDDNRVRGFDTATEALNALKMAKPYSGPFST